MHTRHGCKKRRPLLQRMAEGVDEEEALVARSSGPSIDAADLERLRAGSLVHVSVNDPIEKEEEFGN